MLQADAEDVEGAVIDAGIPARDDGVPEIRQEGKNGHEQKGRVTRSRALEPSHPRGQTKGSCTKTHRAQHTLHLEIFNPAPRFRSKPK